MKISFNHNYAAHCESGVTANLFSHNGRSLSESMAFGIGGGLFFGYFPFIRVNYLPLITYRKYPGGIIKKCASRLGIRLERKKFHSPQKAMDELDRALLNGHPVGLQTGVYWLPYFPPAMRFHFNAHNLVVYGKEGDTYLISDPVIEYPVKCDYRDLVKARFAQGALAPRGHMYYIQEQVTEADIPLAAVLGMREIARTMLLPSAGLFGVGGIRKLAHQISRWPERLGNKKAIQYLGHVIRMQEEIGTGGGGFRYIFSAFLQETAGLLGVKKLNNLSNEITLIGDRWREFALFASRICKGRDNNKNVFSNASLILIECADREERIFREIKKDASSWIKNHNERAVIHQ
ncbi:MAG: BtrH N-terminal domain-containing protein [Desulfatiglans sp.]|nr:BtrH N-terminal domain-containing protein [Desulfatiglans sp.]